MYESRFNPPVRKSLTDAELQDALTLAQADEAGILAAMALLEEQAALRETEKLEFAGWEADLLATGDASAIASINAERALRGLELLEVSVTSRDESPEMPIEELEAPLLIEDVVANLAAQGLTSPVSAAAVDETFGAEEEEFTASQEQQVPIEPILVADVTDAVSLPPVETVDAEQIPFAPLASPKTLDSPIGLPAGQTTDEAKTRTTPEPGRRDTKRTKQSKFERRNLDPRSLSSSQFWSWASLGWSVLPMGLAILLAQLNLSFGQGVLAIALGLAASGSVIAVGALGGKRSGLGTLMLSRAAFGVNGNILPSIILLASRFFAVFALFALVPMLATSSSDSTPLALDFASAQFLVVALLLLALGSGSAFVAIRGGALMHQVQKWGALVGGTAAVLTAALMLPGVNAEALASTDGGGWLATLGAAVLVFSISGLLWSGAGADFARRLRVDQLGSRVVSWVFLAVAIIPFVFAVVGLAFFESMSDANKSQLAQNLLNGISIASPMATVPAMVSAAATIVVGASMALYSTSHSLRTLSIVIKPSILHPILAGLAVTAVLIAAARLGNQDLWYNLGGYLLVLGVPVAAWAGVFACDILIRRIAYHEVSLSRSYGFYKSFNWVNLAGWLTITIIGLGLTVSSLEEFGWLGFLVSEQNKNFWQLSHFAIVISLAGGLLLPALFGVPRIKNQEAEVLSLEARRNDLRDIFGFAD